MQTHHPLRGDCAEMQAMLFTGVTVIGDKDSDGSSHKLLLCYAGFCACNNVYLQLADCFQ